MTLTAAARTGAMTVVSTLKEMQSEESFRRAWPNICQSLVNFTCLHRWYHESEKTTSKTWQRWYTARIPGLCCLSPRLLKPGLPFLTSKSTNGFLTSVLSLWQTSKMCCCGLLMERQWVMNCSSCQSSMTTLTIRHLSRYWGTFSLDRLILLTEVVRLVKLSLVIPETSASAERSFSALCRLKTHIRSTVGQSRLNHLLFLHCHKDRVG